MFQIQVTLGKTVGSRVVKGMGYVIISVALETFVVDRAERKEGVMEEWAVQTIIFVSQNQVVCCKRYTNFKLNKSHLKSHQTN